VLDRNKQNCWEVRKTHCCHETKLARNKYAVSIDRNLFGKRYTMQTQHACKPYGKLTSIQHGKKLFSCRASDR